MPVLSVHASDLCKGDKVGVRGHGSGNQNDLRYFKVTALSQKGRYVSKTRTVSRVEWVHKWTENPKDPEDGYYTKHKEIAYDMFDESYTVDELVYCLDCDGTRVWRRVAAAMPIQTLRAA